MTAKQKHSIIFDKWFLSASLLGTLIMGVLSAYGTLSVQIAIVGTLVSIMTGVSLTVMQEVERFSRQTNDALTNMGLILPLTADSNVRNSYEEIIGALHVVVESPNAVFRTLGRERIAALSHDFRNLSRQRLIYVGTEAWRTAYAEVLQNTQVSEYRSVAWVRSENYWQDQPGHQSLRLNCELAERGVRVTRIIILRASERIERSGEFPATILTWMEVQNRAGIKLMYVDENALLQEKDLLADYGIYGDVAVGILDTDDTSSRTLQFRLSFDAMDLAIHREKWERLLLYATEWHPSGSDSASCVSP